MNWLERARREIASQRTANTADGDLTGAAASIGSIGSTKPEPSSDPAAIREEFEERAAIMEFDGGMTRTDAERAAWAIVSKRNTLH